MRALRGLRSGAVRCKARPPCKQRSGERARLQIGRAEHGELLTQNMLTMLVTRDVSKLSGWLNEYAPCRACRMEGLNGAGGAYVAGRGKRGRAANTGRSGGGGGCGARGGGRRAAGDLRCTRSVRRERERGEAPRTLNIPAMFVTRDVLRCSGWLNHSLCCRGSQKQGIPTACALRPGRRETRRVGGSARGGAAPGTWRSCL